MIKGKAGTPPPAPVQRNALAPALTAALVLLAGIVLVGGGAFSIVRFAVAILALIVAWFAAQSRHWWWIPVFVAIAVLWNPVAPVGLDARWWAVAHLVAIPVFVIAGLTIKTAPTEPSKAR